MSSNLRHFLLEKYGGFADRRVKNKDLDYAIRIDGHGSWIAQGINCSASVRVHDPASMRYSLVLENVPYDAHIEKWVKRYRSKVLLPSGGGLANAIQITLDASNTRAIRSLAGRINQIPNRSNVEASLWPKRTLRRVCKWTARYLQALAANLEEYRCMNQTTRSTPTHALKLSTVEAIPDEHAGKPFAEATTSSVGESCDDSEIAPGWIEVGR